MRDKIDKRLDEMKRQSDKIAMDVEAYELLNRVWVEIGPYGDREGVSDETRNRLRNFFGFDDSE